MHPRHLLPWRPHLLMALAVASVGACARPSGFASPHPGDRASQAHGRLVIIGGGLSRTNEAVYQAVLSGRHGSGPVCVIPTAGAGDPQRAIAGTVATFDQWGGAGSASGIVISTANADAARDPAIVEQIRGCSGFYFTGGVQSRIVTVFRPRGGTTPAYEALMARFREGAVVAGSSAGAAVMSDPMIAGGSTTGALASGIHRAAAESDEDEEADDDTARSGAVSITPGLGFFGDAIVDQHFLARGRIGRLITAVLDLAEFDLGFGIDENTALVVDGRSVHAAGASGVIVLDASAAVRSARGATNLKLHLIGPGDRYDIETRRVQPSADRIDLPAAADSVAVPEDLFARWAFLHVLHQFARSPQTELVLPVNGGELRLRKGPDFSARSCGADGVQGTPSGLSIMGLELEVIR